MSEYIQGSGEEIQSGFGFNAKKIQVYIIYIIGTKYKIDLFS